MASPLEYLERLKLQNELFGDDIQLKGLWLDEANGGWRVVTTQPDVPASTPTQDEIDSAMTSWGFELLPWPDIGRRGAMAYRMGSIAVWDAHPVNAGITPGGLVVPYDFIITRLP